MREIARPNNDTLYISALIDLRKDPVILEMPAFDSDYVSLMVTGYDHYVNVPMATRLGDFKKPEKMLFYTERTEGYDGEPVEGVDRIFECTGDFISAVLRIMPHAKDQERFKRIVGQMEQVKIVTLSEFQGGKAKPIDDIEFPAVGKRDADIFENNLLEVMQFVFNHTTFDPEDELDQALLAAYEPLGVVPGQPYDPAKVAKIDGAKIRKVSERIFAEEMAKTTDEEFAKKELFGKFQPKGQMPLDLLLFQSVIGPIGLPATEAVYPAVATTDGKPTERHERLRDPDDGGRAATHRGVLVAHPLRPQERLLHSQRPEEVQRGRERGHEARRGRRDRGLRRRRETRGRARGELAADQSQG